MLHLETAVRGLKNAGQARAALAACIGLVNGGTKSKAGSYIGGIPREIVEALALDCGGKGHAHYSELSDPSGAPLFTLRHDMDGPSVKQLKADISAVKKLCAVQMPKAVSNSLCKLDGSAMAPIIGDLTVSELARLGEQHGTKITLDRGVIIIGAGRNSVKVDSTDNEVLDADSASHRQLQGKLNAIAYILKVGCRLNKTHNTTLDEARAVNAITPGTFKIPDAFGVLN